MESNQVMIHVRFAPSGGVTEISERPTSANAQEWFDFVSQGTVDCYQALSGGRGIFRVPREQVDALKVSCSK